MNLVMRVSPILSMKLNSLRDVSGMIGGADSPIFELINAVIIQFNDVLIYIHRLAKCTEEINKIVYIHRSFVCLFD